MAEHEIPTKFRNLLKAGKKDHGQLGISKVQGAAAEGYPYTACRSAVPREEPGRRRGWRPVSDGLPRLAGPEDCDIQEMLQRNARIACFQLIEVAIEKSDDLVGEDRVEPGTDEYLSFNREKILKQLDRRMP